MMSVFCAAMALWPSAALAQAGEQSAASVWVTAFFQRGGPVIWVIVLCSVLSITIALERAYTLRKKKIINTDFLHDVKKYAVKGEFEKALMVCRKVDVAMSRITHAGLLRSRFGVLEVERALEAAGAHEATLLEANLRGLGVIASLAPMLGLLGTVTGMINAFSAISLEGVGNPTVVAGGIAEALINTAAGLVVAIYTLGFYHYFRGKVDKLIYEMEEISLRLVEDIMHTVEAVSRRHNEKVAFEDEV